MNMLSIISKSDWFIFKKGSHVNPWLIHVNVWQKPLQYCKVISLQLIKINEKNDQGEKDKFSFIRKTNYRKRNLNDLYGMMPNPKGSQVNANWNYIPLISDKNW